MGSETRVVGGGQGGAGPGVGLRLGLGAGGHGQELANGWGQELGAVAGSGAGLRAEQGRVALSPCLPWGLAKALPHTPECSSMPPEGGTPHSLGNNALQ